MRGGGGGAGAEPEVWESEQRQLVQQFTKQRNLSIFLTLEPVKLFNGLMYPMWPLVVINCFQT